VSNQFRHTVEFRQLQIQKPKTSDEAVQTVSILIDELNKTHNKLQDSFTRLQGATGASSGTIILSGNAVNSTNNSSSVSTDLRANSVAVVAGVNIITFATPMTKDYVIIPIYITPRDIQFLDPAQIVYDMTKFTVTIPSDGVLIYSIMPKT
jgi:hypothetical protein